MLLLPRRQTLASIVTSLLIEKSSAVAVASTTSTVKTTVVGVGVLGTDLCRQLLADPATQVIGVTATTKNHEKIRETVGCTDDSRFRLTTSEDTSEEVEKTANVVFCAPPSGFENYPEAVQTATEKYWLGPDTGKFVFTSSGAV